MDLNKIIEEYWGDMFNNKITTLSTYRFQRNLDYPEVPIVPFTNYFLHKQWMREELKRIQRKYHNAGVLKRFHESKNQPPAS